MADVTVGDGMRFTVINKGNTGSNLTAISGDGTTIIGSTTLIIADNQSLFVDAPTIAGGATRTTPPDYSSDDGTISFRDTFSSYEINENNLVFSPNLDGYSATNLSINSRDRMVIWDRNNKSQSFFLEDTDHPRILTGDFVVENSVLLPESYTSQILTGVSGDGLTLIGMSSTSQGKEAFRWTEPTGLVSLNKPDNWSFYSRATTLSSDGSVIVGEFVNDENNASPVDQETREAFIWTEPTGFVGLGKLPGDTSSSALDVSGDGKVAVGFSRGSNFLSCRAFRWTEDSGLVNLGSPENHLFSTAIATNADGSTVVGTVASADEHLISIGDLANALTGEAVIWKTNANMLPLGHLHKEDTYSIATGITPDGSVVIGSSSQPIELLNTTNYVSLTNEAFRWNETEGMQSIGEWLADNGYSLPENIILQSPAGVNDNGTVIIGNNALVTEEETTVEVWGPWVATGERGFITINDFTNSFTTTASIPQVSSSLPSIALHGAHHQPLLAQKRLNKDQCAWINGDFANYQSKKADSHLVETGACVDFQSNTRVGIGIGKSRVDQALDYSGSSDIDGKYLLVELDHQLLESPMLLSATVLHGNWDADINRGYLNAGSEDLSKGSTSIKATAIRGRIDWRDLYTIDNTTITPKIEYTITNTDVDGYTETTGGFPARFDPQSHTSRESRIGIIAENILNSKTTIRGIAEEVHRFDRRGAAFSGEVIDMFPFSIPGAENRSDWLRVGAEIDYQLDKEMFLSGSLMRSSRGEDAEISGAFSLKVAL